jgi:hypothetical protein
LDDSLLFAGGSTHTERSEGIPKLYAITFDEQLQVVDSLNLILPSAPPKAAVFSLRRYPESDVLLAGVFQTLFVVEWTGTHFAILNVVEELHTCKSMIIK